MNACPAFARIAGSLAPSPRIIASDHSWKRCRSSRRMPIISAMTASGSGTATSSTKSQSPFAAIASSDSVTIPRNATSSFFTMRGEKPLLIRLRSLLWRGSPSSISPIFGAFPSRTPCAEVKRSWSLETYATSSYLVTIQQPSFSDQCTGSLRRSQRIRSCTDASHVAGSRKATFTSFASMETPQVVAVGSAGNSVVMISRSSAVCCANIGGESRSLPLRSAKSEALTK